jgi:hypothetical protein
METNSKKAEMVGAWDERIVKELKYLSQSI